MRTLVFLLLSLAFVAADRAHAIESHDYLNITVYDPTLTEGSGSEWPKELARLVFKQYPDREGQITVHLIDSLGISVHRTLKRFRARDVICAVKIAHNGKTLHHMTGLFFEIDKGEARALINHVAAEFAVTTSSNAESLHQKLRNLKSYLEFVRDELQDPQRQAVVGGMVDALPSELKLNSPTYRRLFAPFLREKFDLIRGRFVEAAPFLGVDLKKMNEAFARKSSQLLLGIKPADNESLHYLKLIEADFLSDEMMALAEAVYARGSSIAVRIDVNDIISVTTQTPVGLGVATITLLVEMDGAHFYITASAEFSTREKPQNGRLSPDVSWAADVMRVLSHKIARSPQTKALLDPKTLLMLPDASCDDLLK